MNKKIIFLLVILGICLLLASPTFAKEKVKVKITTEDHPFSYNGYIVIKLIDSKNRTELAHGRIYYKITDKNGNYFWKKESFHNKVSIKVPNGKYKVKVKYYGDDNHKSAKSTKTVTVDTDGSLNPYTYYENHNYGNNLLYDEYIYDNYWDEEIYDDASNYDGEGY